MPENDVMGRDRDLVLPPSTYAYVLDSTKGKVSVYVGPFKNSLSNTDQLVVWNAADQRFTEVSQVEQAIKTFQKAGEGEYIVLHNPAAGSAPTPPRGTVTDAADLEEGRQVNAPGPISFPLWPGQSAQTIPGHHLRHNQYLIVRVYDPVQAAENWESGVIATQADTDASAVVQDTNFAMGQLIVIQGTDVSFYIPPTGIEVVPEGGTVANGVTHGGTFVREAVTLERLEYCILLDEDGEKRYVRGPDVVFPTPTEQFVVQDGQRKFRAIELNDHSGIFVKVIAEYEEDGITHPVGQELFITGESDPIYFPRPEHSIIQYGSKRVHHAVAIPEGEGRYVLDRDQGTVDLVQGPKMYLPDPRHEVVVLRILDPHIVDLFYPGNAEAQEVNRRRTEISGRIGPDEHLTHERTVAAYNVAMDVASASTRSILPEGVGETMRRGTTYTPPRSIVLDTKYDGAVTLNIWPGYAVLVTDKTDNRRVEVGPKAVLLEYDETLMPLTLSTGTPKNDKHLLRAGYLRIINNQVSDEVEVETRDLVAVTVRVSYRVNFEGDTQEDRQRWFAIENYVKVLTDHCRSRLRNVAKRHGILEFYTASIDIIRDTLLGESIDGERTGMSFPENNMRLYDVEVLDVEIRDDGVAELLVEAQTSALTGAIQLSTTQEATEREALLEELRRQRIDNKEETARKEAEVALAAIERDLAARLSILVSDLQTTTARQEIDDEILAGQRKVAEQEIKLVEARDVVEMERLIAETNEYIRRMAAIDPTLVTAIQSFGDQAFVDKLVTSMGPAALAAGVTTADLFGQIFKGTPFEGMMEGLASRPLARRNGAREPIAID